MHLFLLIMLSTIPITTADKDTQDSNPLTNYQAHYHVLRDGKAMALQTTTLKKTDEHLYTLKDSTKGTQGMAAFLGFERTATSEFTVDKDQWVVQQHNMKQKATLSKRKYSFEQKPEAQQIEGTHKKEKFQVEHLSQQPISSHMLPLRIAFLACHKGFKSFDIDVLKSKKISHYQFTASPSGQLIKVSRIYPENNPKSSHIWLDPNQNCLAIKTEYNDGDSVLETRLRKSR